MSKARPSTDTSTLERKVEEQTRQLQEMNIALDSLDKHTTAFTVDVKERLQKLEAALYIDVKERLQKLEAALNEAPAFTDAM